MTKKTNFAYFTLALAMSLTMAQASGPAPFQHGMMLLNNPDPALRDMGRQELMGLSISDVDLLRQSLRQTPCTPAQAEALEEIVTYVVARAQVNPASGSGEAFLGILFTNDGVDEVDPAEIPPRGVPIRPVPGFIAYRFLQEGDVIVGVGSGNSLRRTQTAERFRAAVSAYSAGEPLTLQVQRGARLLAIALTPDRRPEDARDVNLMQQRIDRAQADAERYWTENFQPLIQAVE